MINPSKQTDRQPSPKRSSIGALMHRLIEPPVLFSIIAVLVLAVIWTATLQLVAREHAAAHRAAVTLTADLTDTYEAQVVRALREISQTLRLVRYQLNNTAPADTLADLAERGLLPPPLLFTIRIADASGSVVASNGEAGPENLAGTAFFEAARSSDDMIIGLPQRDDATGGWLLSFSLRLGGADEFAGVVMLTVHAGYFVSGYESEVLGSQGLLGLLGSDGVFRVRRVGDEITAGGTVDYDAWVPDDLPVDDEDASNPDSAVRIAVHDWDEVPRYTLARQLYGFPLALVVGVSEEEQHETAAQSQSAYLWRAVAASVVLLAVLALLGRLGWQLQRERSRVMTERVEHAERVEYLAFHDSLTDLPNRAFFSRLLTQGMQQARRYRKTVALLFLDLDRFKIINDSLGHDAGDELLCEIARRLRDAVRESDIVARLGGDEFVILLPEITSGSQVAAVADKILATVGKPFTLAGQEFRVTVSIGVTLFPDDGEDEQTLMKNADVAMYHAKQQGKNNFQFYSEQLNANSLERLALESGLRSAIERGEFRLFYQAQKNMATGRITGMEALLRWQHPELGLVAPMQFIPLAEETGLIVSIGRWVLKTACEQNVAWQKEGFPALSMAVNLSARQFLDEALLEDVKSVLRETAMDPELLELEITESMIMQDLERTIQILRDLKAMGVKVAIDDFGTGYSSLSALKDFPLNTIKIDGSFIRDVVRSSEDQGLAEAIIAVGRSLGLTVVAECVETAEQEAFLRTHLCDEFQGFFINEPMPADEFARLVRGQPVL